MSLIASNSEHSFVFIHAEQCGQPDSESILVISLIVAISKHNPADIPNIEIIRVTEAVQQHDLGGEGVDPALDVVFFPFLPHSLGQ